MNSDSKNTVIVLDGAAGMTPGDFHRVVYEGARVELSASLLASLATVREKLDALIAVGEPIYGVNTGVGSKKGETVENMADILEFQRIFIAAHCTGVGEPLPEDVARGMVYLRLLSFTRNHSGVRPELAMRLAAMLNCGITPIIPSQGSVGASGDLAPLSHLAACAMGVLFHRNADGSLLPLEKQPQAIFGGEIMDAGKAWHLADERESFELAAKEALALSNGATLILSEGLVSLLKIESLFGRAIEAAAIACEALRAETRAFDERIAAARAHNGAVKVSKMMREMLAGSGFCTPKFRKEFAAAAMLHFPDRPARKLDPKIPRLQDAYSFRAIPQVLGACLDAMDHARAVFTREMESATDNPLFFENEDEGGRIEVLSGANFHGEPLALVADYLKIAAAEIASLSERRIAALLDPAHNYGLPADLAQTPADTGLMILQYTAAALVSENKTLAHPGSVDSIPTSAGQEDHVSMGSISTRQLRRIVENLKNVIAIEIICGVCGVRALAGICDKGNIAMPRFGEGTDAAFADWSEKIGNLYSDTYLATVIARIATDI